MQKNKKKIVLVTIFIAYFLFLIKAILFKYPYEMLIDSLQFTNFDYIKRRLLIGSNFIPLKTILSYMNAISYSNSGNAKINLYANLLLFMPLGFLIPLIFKKINNYKKIFFIAFSISLLFEAIQLIFGIRTFDVDDLILNTLGAIIGLLIFKLIKYIN